MLNDPDGLYYDSASGLYHVFYQYQLGVFGDGFVKWGHAAGKTLFSLKEYPYAIGIKPGVGAFSGGAIIDEENASGLFSKASKPCSRAFFAFTECDLETRAEKQNCAFTEDGFGIETGGTIVENDDLRYAPNTFRDPSLFRFDGKFFMMTGGCELRLFSSDDLKNWKFESFVENVSASDKAIIGDMNEIRKYLPLNDPESAKMAGECPDVFRLNGSEDNEFFLSAGGVFFVSGIMTKKDGVYRFEPRGERTKSVYSANFFSGKGEAYAMQTFRGLETPVALFWLRDLPREQNKPFNGCLSLPYEVYFRRGEVRFKTTREYSELKREAYRDGATLEITSDEEFFSFGVRYGDKEIPFVADENGLRIGLKGSFGFTEDIFIPRVNETTDFLVLFDGYVVEGLYQGRLFSFFDDNYSFLPFKIAVRRGKPRLSQIVLNKEQ